MSRLLSGYSRINKRGVNMKLEKQTLLMMSIRDGFSSKSFRSDVLERVKMAKNQKNCCYGDRSDPMLIFVAINKAVYCRDLRNDQVTKFVDDINDSKYYNVEEVSSTEELNVVYYATKAFAEHEEAIVGF